MVRAFSKFFYKTTKLNEFKNATLKKATAVQRLIQEMATSITPCTCTCISAPLPTSCNKYKTNVWIVNEITLHLHLYHNLKDYGTCTCSCRWYMHIHVRLFRQKNSVTFYQNLTGSHKAYCRSFDLENPVVKMYLPQKAAFEVLLPVWQMVS